MESVKQQIEEIMKQNPKTILLDGTQTGIVDCMGAYEGFLEDVVDYQFFPETKDELPAIVVWEVADDTPDDDYDTSPAGAWY